MRQLSTVDSVRAFLAPARRDGRRIGLVPTMGALHDGHLALVDDARRRADLVVLSLFVNPLQFAAGEDLDRYPRDLARDVALAAARGVDLLFAPTVEEMYGAGRELRIVGGATANLWEGAIRPGHFDGVLTVVAKLFNIIQPQLASFGQKDIQQVTLVRQLIEQLNIPVELSMVPTVREADGLALSSRNVYLSASERVTARALSAALRAAAQGWSRGERDAAVLHAFAEAVLAGAPGIVTDYIAVVDGARMLPADAVVAGSIMAVAARVGSTRLIDNIIFGQKGL